MKTVMSRLRSLMADNTHNFFAISLLFAIAVMLRAISAGFEYLPILDDSIQYINFQRYGDFWGIIETQGLFSSRPLAALIDLFLVG